MKWDRLFSVVIPDVTAKQTGRSPGTVFSITEEVGHRRARIPFTFESVFSRVFRNSTLTLNLFPRRDDLNRGHDPSLQVRVGSST